MLNHNPRTTGLFDLTVEVDYSQTVTQFKL